MNKVFIRIYFIVTVAMMAVPAFGVCEPTSRPRGYRFPIVLKAQRPMLGGAVHNFEAWARKEGAWKQIAIQIDEVNAEGSYVLEEGMPYTKFTGSGRVKADDEVSFKGPEIGESFVTADVTPVLKQRFSRYFAIHTCNSGGEFLGSILVGETNLAAVQPHWEPLYQKNKSEVKSALYRYKFSDTQPMLLGDVFLRLKGQESQVFSNSSFKMPINPKYWPFPGFNFDVDDFDSEIECWRSGPVRSIVAVGAKIKKFFSLLNLHMFSELVFYENFFQIPTQIDFTFDANRMLDYGSGLAYILRFPPGREWAVKSNLDTLPETAKLAGKNGLPLKTALQQSPEGIFQATGHRPEGSFLARVRVDPKASAMVPPPFMISPGMFDATPWSDQWKWLRGVKGDFGVYLDISQVKKGFYDFALDLMLSTQANDSFADFQAVTSKWVDLAHR